MAQPIGWKTLSRVLLLGSSPGTARKGGALLVKANVLRLALTLASLAALAAVVGAGIKW
jgi:hypothetical protein